MFVTVMLFVSWSFSRIFIFFVFFFKQKTAYEMRISDWSSDVCSSDLVLSRYGGESDGVALDKLGGEAWQRRKARMKERIREIAGELLSTAALRALRSGDILAADAAYPAFADRFPYQETDDQDRAIGDVLADMASGRPMDRLVCGEIGRAHV